MDKNTKIIFFGSLGIVAFMFLICILLYVLFSGKGSLHITTEPPGATIYLDGYQKGQSPLQLKDIKKGKHKITAKKEGLSDKSQEIEVKKGENKVELELSKATGINMNVLKATRLVLTSKFEIVQKSQGEYLIFLKATYNRPSQYEKYIKNLKEYKKEALAWLRTNGIDYSKATIEYVPKEAKDL